MEDQKCPQGILVQYYSIGTIVIVTELSECIILLILWIYCKKIIKK